MPWRRGAPPVSAVAREYATGDVIPRHVHRRAQLVFAVSGVMRVETGEGSWVVPSQRAVWVPAGVAHSIAMDGAVSMRSIYVTPATAREAGLPGGCCVVAVTPLLRELILDSVAHDRSDARNRHVTALILEEIRALPALPLHLPQPADPRLRRVCEALRRDPAANLSLAAHARAASASERTLARLFQRQTGMTFGQWRQQLRLTEALRRLAAGAKVTSVALDLGYDSPSAFTAMFRRVLGVPPGRYFADPPRAR